mgnify:CR=1 FL=1
MLKRRLCRAAAGLLAGAALLTAVPDARAADPDELSQPIENPYVDRFDGRTLEEIMADFMTENGVGGEQFFRFLLQYCHRREL